jgi:hypothetical protein
MYDPTPYNKSAISLPPQCQPHLSKSGVGSTKHVCNLAGRDSLPEIAMRQGPLN